MRKRLILPLILMCAALLTSCGRVADNNQNTPEPSKPVITEAPMDYESYKVNERYFIYRIWNFNITTMSVFKSTVNTAMSDGFNAIMIHIPWLHVEKASHGEYNFSKFDPMLEYVIKEKGAKVIVSVDFTRKEKDTLLTDDCFMMSLSGKISSGGVAFNKKQISFSSETAMSYATDFYRELCSHYNDLYGSDILCYIPAFTQYCETEYWCTDDYDYSANALANFRTYLRNRFASVSELNLACGKSFTDFDSVTPPSGRDRSDFGMIWYSFRHQELKNAIDRLASAQKSVAPESKIAIQLGSVFDDASILRCTYNFPSLCENVDILWTDDGPTYNHTFSMDYIRSNLPSSVQIATEIDGPSQNGASVENYNRQGNEGFAHGASYVNIANWFIDASYSKYKETWQNISQKWLSDSGSPENVIPGDSSRIITVSLSDMISGSGFGKILSEYEALKAEDEFVFIKLLGR